MPIRFVGLSIWTRRVRPPVPNDRFESSRPGSDALPRSRTFSPASTVRSGPARTVGGSFGLLTIVTAVSSTDFVPLSSTAVRRNCRDMPAFHCRRDKGCGCLIGLRYRHGRSVHLFPAIGPDVAVRVQRTPLQSDPHADFDRLIGTGLDLGRLVRTYSLQRAPPLSPTAGCRVCRICILMLL